MSDRRAPGPIRRLRSGPSRPLDRRRRAALAIGAVVALLAVAALIGGGADPDGRRSFSTAGDAGGGSGGSSFSEPAMDDAASSSRAPADDERAGAASTSAVDADATIQSDGSAAGEASGEDTVGQTAEAKIIRTGSLEVEVAEGAFQDGVSSLTRIATGLGGFVSASEIRSFDDDPHGSVTLRIPADQFDKALVEIGDMGTVEALTTGSQDVTAEYTDVAARRKALEAEREQINLVLSRAESIPDILSVRDRLSVVQQEIEQLQGRQKVLDDQTSLATLTVGISEKGSTSSRLVATPERRGLAKLWHDSTDRFTDGGRSIALGLATMAPWLLLALVLWLPTRALWRRLAPAEPPAHGEMA